MKDEEMAEQFADNISGLELTCSVLASKDKNHAYRLGRYEGFLAGLKAGRPQWHKVADGDYPKEKGNYLVAWKRTHHVEEYGLWGFDVDLFNADEGYFEGVGDYVIAWCEIPTFDKE